VLSIRLPDKPANCFNIECVLSTGETHFISTKRCQTVNVSEDTVEMIVTPMLNGVASEPVVIDVSAYHINFRHAVGVTVA
jgi:hypothetical protein